MKYKNIKSAIHNFGYSYLSYENYVDGDFVFRELKAIHAKGYDISIDWLSRTFEPRQFYSTRIEKSIGYWTDSLRQHLLNQNVSIESLTDLHLKWPAKQGPFIHALDDRNVEHKKEIKYPS
ncbi:hypothetical protein GCE9029_01020 [Grimontia celer]|uniref:Uncharacterized protein n=1 Tax=Grimontia celer TaxID=1796497 RepID=A0A128EVY0_9GAMM|nr:hypothetical protein [Grimontia celer]CZF78729.1 hypothetical protein GCE9029_01020 [Grimontia celer]